MPCPLVNVVAQEHRGGGRASGVGHMKRRNSACPTAVARLVDQFLLLKFPIYLSPISLKKTNTPISIANRQRSKAGLVKGHSATSGFIQSVGGQPTFY